MAYHEDFMRNYVIRYKKTGAYLLEGFGLLFMVTERPSAKRFTFDDAVEQIKMMAIESHFEIEHIWKGK